MQKSFDQTNALLADEKTRHKGAVLELEKSQVELLAALKKAHETMLGKFRNVMPNLRCF